MTDERAAQAVRRIERAIERMDAALSRPRPAAANNGELLRLREAHEALRIKVQEAIGELDELIEAEED